MKSFFYSFIAILLSFHSYSQCTSGFHATTIGQIRFCPETWMSVGFNDAPPLGAELQDPNGLSVTDITAWMQIDHIPSGVGENSGHTYYEYHVTIYHPLYPAMKVDLYLYEVGIIITDPDGLENQFAHPWFYSFVRLPFIVAN